MQLYHCHGYASNGAPQRWVFIQPEDTNGNPIYDTNGSPVYEIYNLAADLCLTAQNLLAGMPLTPGTCNRVTTYGPDLVGAARRRQPGRSGFRDLPVARRLHLRQLRRREQRLRQQPHPPGDGALRPQQHRPGLELG